MTQTDIKIGPLRPTTGPLARLGGAAAAQPLGGGSLPDQIGELQQIVRALQDQVYAVSQFLDQLISVPMMVASGDNHQPGVVPDPGAAAGTSKFLREDATFTAVSATALTGILPVVNGGTGVATSTGTVAVVLSTSPTLITPILGIPQSVTLTNATGLPLTTGVTGTLPVANGGTGTTSGSITGTTALTFTAGGAAQNVTLISSTTGKVVAKPGTDSTTAIQLQNAAGTAVLNVDTTNSRVGIGAAVTPATTVDIGGTLATRYSGITCVNGANANVALGGGTYVRITGPTAIFSISGFVAGSDGQHMELWNASGFAMTLQNANGGSTAANQIFTNTGADLVLGAFSFVGLIYDLASLVWVVRSHT